MSSPIKVFVFGGTGNTAQQIIDGMIKSPTNFDITAISRPSSVDKPENVEYRKRGVKVVGLDADVQRGEAVELLRDADVVIAPANFFELDKAKALVDVCKEAGVRRFVPNNFAPVMPAYGVMGMREKKEEIVNHIRLRRLPYTVVDVAWWYQNLPYRVPSGRTDYIVVPPMDDARLWGDGSTPIAFSDIHSIGPHAARILADPRTLNKHVHVYDQVLSSHQVVDALEELSGEKVERTFFTKEQMEETMAQAKDALAKDPDSEEAITTLTCVEYWYSMGVRGDSVPEVADYLGYLDSRKLYPDIEPITVKDFYKDVLGGKALVPYADEKP
ncbi:hypothetical protein RB597_007863 [Gaeumannomyces tritici]